MNVILRLTMLRAELYNNQRAIGYLGGGLGALGLTTPVVSYGPRGIVIVWICDLESVWAPGGLASVYNVKLFSPVGCRVRRKVWFAVDVQVVPRAKPVGEQ